MKDFIIIATTSYQISEDKWQVANVSFIGNENTTIEQIFEWAAKKKVDLNTIRILPTTTIELK